MLSLRAEPDPERPLGHARIVLEGVAGPLADASFSIRREGYPSPNLGPRGWQVREERLAPLQASQEGSDTVLLVGPAVTRHLEPAPYIFLLPGAGLERPLFWPDTIDVFDGDLPDMPPPPPEPPPVPPPVYSPPPVSPPVAAPPVTPPSVATLPRAETPPSQVSVEPNATVVKPDRRLLLGLGVLLLAAAVGGWWVLGTNRSDPTASPPASPPSAATIAPAPPAPVQPTAVPWLERTDGLILREVVETAPDAAGIYAAALRRQAVGRYDDALVLFEEAGERGHAPALTAIARLYDPNGFTPGRPFRNPDPRAAARYYRDAVVKGDAAAAEPRAALRVILEEQARGGNGTAETALREFWP